MSFFVGRTALSIANLTFCSFSNTVQSMQAVLEALPLLSVVLLPSNQEAAYLVEEVDPDERSIDKELEQALVTLWHDPAVKAVLGELLPSIAAASEERADPFRFVEVKSRFQVRRHASFESNAEVLTRPCSPDQRLRRVLFPGYQPHLQRGLHAFRPRHHPVARSDDRRRVASSPVSIFR